MTYCVGLKLNNGIVFASDTRTNAGLDNVATFSKMHVWADKGHRVLVLLSAGNLAVTQSVISLLNEQNDRGSELLGPSVMTAETLFQAANLIGETVRNVANRYRGPSQDEHAMFGATFIFGGQIAGEEPRLFQIYSEGNFIEATEDTPYFQIGEHKYGKPILDRVTLASMRMGEAAKLLLLSFDSTLRSNLSVGMPIDLLIYRRGQLAIAEKHRIEANDAYFRKLSESWSRALREAFANLDEYEGMAKNAPEFDWDSAS